jgi:YVTN family beta-propeller protein
MMRAEFRILGPLEVWTAAGEISLPTGRPRAVLALLLIHANETLSVDRIVYELWDGHEPSTAAKIVQGYVSQLRRALGDERIATRGRGYRLVLSPGELDVDSVEQLRRRAHGEAPETAAATLREAHARFRGAPLEDFSDESFSQVEAARLEALRLAVVRERIEADLDLGRHVDVVPELEALVARHPLDEGLRRQLMLALYRCGRQADALTAYRAGRQRMADELGLEPTVELRELERQILDHDPTLRFRGPGPAPPSPVRARRNGRSGSRLARGRAPAFVVAGTFLLVGALLGALLALGRDEGSAALVVPADAVAVVDPERHEVVAAIPVGGRPENVVAGAGAVWVANVDDETISRIDPRTLQVTATVGLGFEPTDVAATAEHVWVVGGYDHVLWRLDHDGKPRLKLRFVERLGPLPAGFENGRAGIAAGAGGIWLSHGDEVTLLDPATGDVRATVKAGGRWASEIAVDRNAVWVFNNDTARPGADAPRPAVHVIDASSRRVTARRELASAVREVLAASGLVWVALDRADAVWEFDSGNRTLLRTFSAGDEPEGLAFVDESLWVTNESDATLRRIDPGSGETQEIVQIGHTLEDVAAHDGRLWVAVRRP